MATDFNASLTSRITSEAKLLDSRGKVSRFAYTEQALTNDDVYGVETYNYNNAQNVPVGDSATLQMSDDILSKGVRSQASSFTRMGVNHFFGRCSYNINKLSEHVQELMKTLRTFLKEGDNAWSPTASYSAKDLVYIQVTSNGVSWKRTFSCLQANINLCPLDDSGNIINPTYWQEISGNIKGDLQVEGVSRFKNDAVFDQNIAVRGDLIVEGSALITEEETLNTKADHIVLRENNASPLSSTEKAGMVIHNYDTNKNAFIGVGSDGEFRVSDSALENTVSYTNISKFNGNYYSLLSSSPVSVVNGVPVSYNVDEKENCVLEQGTYYHLFNGQWFSLSLVNNGLYFDETAPITDSALVAVLDSLSKDILFYFRNLSVLVINDSMNQPLLTRQEANDLANDDILRWDSVNRRAKGGLKVSDITSMASSFMIASSRTLTGGALTTGVALSIYFTSAINGSNIDRTLTLNYNGTDYVVKVIKDDVLADFEAVLLNGDYKFIKANTALTLLFDGAQFIVTDNPVVLNDGLVDIHANGESDDTPTGNLMALITSVTPHGYLSCDGTDTTGTDIELATRYPKLYALLGNSNILPDYQECVLVGAGHNITNIFDSTETNPSTGVAGTQVHDVYTVGEFKDDQMRSHRHYKGSTNANGVGKDVGTDGFSGGIDYYTTTAGDVTHGKQKGAHFVIRAR